MAAAFILFDATARPTDLPALKAVLIASGAAVRDVKWRFGEEVVFQLEVAARAPFRIEINDAEPEDIAEEAAEMVEDFNDGLSETDIDRICGATARLEIVGPDDDQAELLEDGSVVSYAGVTNIDPQAPDTLPFLLALTAHVDGYLFDNTEGSWMKGLG